MSLLIIILLILTGLLLFAVEFLIIPGISIAGIGGFIFIVGGIYYGYASYGPATGTAILAVALALTIVSIVMMLRSKTWKRTMLETNIDSHVPDVSALNIKVGDRGITVSRLTPIGKLKINDTFIEAKSQTGFIDQKTEVEIVKIYKTNVIVKPINT